MTSIDLESHDKVQAIDKSERWRKFVFLVVGIMFFFGCHNYMQELIMNLPGFKVIDSMLNTSMI